MDLTEQISYCPDENGFYWAWDQIGPDVFIIDCHIRREKRMARFLFAVDFLTKETYKLDLKLEA